MPDISFFDNLDWRGCAFSSRRAKTDVSIRVGESVAGRKSLHLTFRNDVDQLITDNGRIEFVRNKCVVMFRQAVGVGVKLSTNEHNKVNNRYVKTSYKEGDEELCGDYELQFEPKFGVYFIDLEEKL